MLRFLLLLVVAVPLADMFILFKIGQASGISQVLLLAIGTGFAGAVLYRLQRRQNALQAQYVAGQGRLPDVEMVDRLIIYVGMVLMIVPGLITDIAGLSALLPFSRPMIRNSMKSWLKDKIKASNIEIQAM
ncbi:MAG: FxsA family protein [Candidatus Nanohaloarchaea archaeon]|nr:FxsA family protein [Candidatus Nanohaloarchaea archaeon]